VSLSVADEVQQFVRANLRRRGENVIAMRGQCRVAQVRDSMEQRERAIAGLAGYPPDAQIVHDGCAMHLLHRDGTQLEDLRIAEACIGNALHLALVQRMPLQVARRLGEQLGADALRDFVAAAGVLAQGVLGLAHQAR
jgi:hypothetical protein